MSPNLISIVLGGTALAGIIYAGLYVAFGMTP